MALLVDGKLVDDPWLVSGDEDDLPAGKPIVVSLSRWQAERDSLVGREAGLGIRLRSDESPAQIADAVEHFELIELEFPAFKDGRAYTYARLLRERFGYHGQLRAVGDVLLEQLLFMHRCGFNAFEIDSQNALDDWVTATSEISVWYQPTADGQATALQLRRSQRGD